MGSSGKIRGFLGLAAAGALAYFLLRPTAPLSKTEPEESARPAATSAPAPDGANPAAPTPARPAAEPPTAPPSTTPAAPAPPPPSTATTPAVPQPVPAPPVDLTIDLGEVHSTLRDFRTMMGENPVGTNAEITKALLGANLKQVKLPVPAGSQLNGNGELCDRWGTPYFFHQLSKDRMEIRSAGPDRQMWTADDRQQ